MGASRRKEKEEENEKERDETKGGDECDVSEWKTAAVKVKRGNEVVRTGKEGGKV